jgi:hypothetical protein
MHYSVNTEGAITMNIIQAIHNFVANISPAMTVVNALLDFANLSPSPIGMGGFGLARQSRVSIPNWKLPSSRAKFPSIPRS